LPAVTSKGDKATISSSWAGAAAGGALVVWAWIDAKGVSVIASTAARHESMFVVFMFGDTGRIVGLGLRISSERIPRSKEHAVEVCSFDAAFI
jgi:hypothetical protein